MSSKFINIALAQINPTIANIKGNTSIIINSLIKAQKLKVNIIAFPEMSIIGYPPQDLLFDNSIIKANTKALDKIAPYTAPFDAVIIGFCRQAQSNKIYNQKLPKQNLSYILHKPLLYNSFALFSHGKIIGYGDKLCLPNYGIFDDFRYFIPAKKASSFKIPLNSKNFNKSSLRIGILVCEDIWHDSKNHPIYPNSPIKQLEKQNIDLLFVINASPFEIHKLNSRKTFLAAQAAKYSIPIFYVNMWGGNDKIIFDGYSMMFDKRGTLFSLAKGFQDDLSLASFDLESCVATNAKYKIPTEYELIFNALVTGKRDYHRKCFISKSVIGVSGGIDSALSLAIDVEAIGNKNVLAIISPSRYSSKESLNDAITLCKNFNVEYKIIPLEYQISSPTKDNPPATTSNSDNQDSWKGVLPQKYSRYYDAFGLPSKNIVFENMQAIDRMSILRAVANEQDRLVSGTSNKTELALGYATVCGDLQADIIIIGDLYKYQVYKLAEFINNKFKKKLIPQSIISRTPSAELAPNQIDPFDYSKLDLLVKLKIEDKLSLQELIASKKLSAIMSDKDITYYNKLIDINEHKRFKSGYILKISCTAFGEDRRFNTAKHINID